MIIKRLCKLLRVVWRQGELTDSSHTAEGIFIPKGENSKGPFHSLTWKGMCLAVLARQMTRYILYMLDNK